MLWILLGFGVYVAFMVSFIVLPDFFDARDKARRGEEDDAADQAPEASSRSRGHLRVVK